MEVNLNIYNHFYYKLIVILQEKIQKSKNSINR